MNQFKLFTIPREHEMIAQYTKYISKIRIARQTIQYRLGWFMTLTIETTNQQNIVWQSLLLIMLTNLHNPKPRLSLISHHEQDESVVNQVSVV